MEKFINNINNKTAVIINSLAAGMCEKTRGLTLVIYEYEGEDYGYTFVMEHKEFYKKFSKVI
jgi:hypothetical protein